MRQPHQSQPVARRWPSTPPSTEPSTPFPMACSTWWKALEETATSTATSAPRAVQVRVLGAFAAIAFLLAGIGLHGLLSFTVSSRSQEFGVRMALGAQRSNILTMVLRDGALLAAAGIVPGVILAYIAGRSMSALLAGVTPTDLPTFAGPGTEPSREHLAISPSELALKHRLRKLRRHCRRCPRRMAETDRHARNHHIHRKARLGSRRSVAMTFGITH